jgi:hypothetical protein
MLEDPDHRNKSKNRIEKSVNKLTRRPSGKEVLVLTQRQDLMNGNDAIYGDIFCEFFAFLLNLPLISSSFMKEHFSSNGIHYNYVDHV